MKPQFLDEINWILPPEEGGQIVQSYYGWHEANLYQKIEDRSDGSIDFYKIKLPNCCKFPGCEIPDDFWNGTPAWIFSAKSKKIYSFNKFSS